MDRYYRAQLHYDLRQQAMAASARRRTRFDALKAVADAARPVRTLLFALGWGSDGRVVALNDALDVLGAAGAEVGEDGN